MAAGKALKLFGMRSKDYAFGQLLQPSPIAGKHIETVGINHNGGLGTAYLRYKGYGRRLLPT